MKDLATQNKIPGLVWIVLGFTLLAVGVSGRFMGFNMSGIAWVVPLMFAAVILVRRIHLVSFPIIIWIPWVALLICYLIVSDPMHLDPRVNPLQRTIQLICPLVIGMAASTYRLSPNEIEAILGVLRKFSYILFFLATFGSLSLILAGLPTGLAAQVMTACVLAVLFITRYLVARHVRDLWVYIMMATLSVISVTRTVIAVMLLMLPMSFAPIGLFRRLLILFVGIGVSVWIFYLPQVQSKMFFSGHGDITDISFDNPDFETSGRSYMWRIAYSIAGQSPLFGHGTGGAETLSYKLANLAYLHNDWLVTYFDYGILGVLVFFALNLLMMIHCYRSAKKSLNKSTNILFLAGAATFIPFMLIMFTDNIMVYASFFGNLQYLIIGLAYGAYRNERQAGEW